MMAGSTTFRNLLRSQQFKSNDSIKPQSRRGEDKVEQQGGVWHKIPFNDFSRVLYFILLPSPYSFTN